LFSFAAFVSWAVRLLLSVAIFVLLAVRLYADKRREADGTAAA